MRGYILQKKKKEAGGFFFFLILGHGSNNSTVPQCVRVFSGNGGIFVLLFLSLFLFFSVIALDLCIQVRLHQTPFSWVCNPKPKRTLSRRLHNPINLQIVQTNKLFPHTLKKKKRTKGRQSFGMVTYCTYTVHGLPARAVIKLNLTPQ